MGLDRGYRLVSRTKYSSQDTWGQFLLGTWWPGPFISASPLSWVWLCHLDCKPFKKRMLSQCVFTVLKLVPWSPCESRGNPQIQMTEWKSATYSSPFIIQLFSDMIIWGSFYIRLTNVGWGDEVAAWCRWSQPHAVRAVSPRLRKMEGCRAAESYSSSSTWGQRDNLNRKKKCPVKLVCRQGHG